MCDLKIKTSFYQKFLKKPRTWHTGLQFFATFYFLTVVIMNHLIAIYLRKKFIAVDFRTFSYFLNIRYLAG